MRIDLAILAFSLAAGLFLACAVESLDRSPRKLLNRNTLRFELPSCSTDMECSWKYGEDPIVEQ